MTFLIPKLFRNIIAAPSSAHTKDKLEEAITTIALGVLMATSVQILRPIPLAGLVAMIGFSFIDSAGSSCAVALSASYATVKIGKQATAYTKAGQPIPIILIPLALFCIGVAWYFFNNAGNKPKGLLRPS